MKIQAVCFDMDGTLIRNTDEVVELRTAVRCQDVTLVTRLGPLVPSLQQVPLHFVTLFSVQLAERLFAS